MHPVPDVVRTGRCSQEEKVIDPRCYFVEGTYATWRQMSAGRTCVVTQGGWMVLWTLCKSLLSASLGILSQWMVTPFRPPVLLAFSRGVVCP